jgi:MFS family permease
VPLIVGLVGLIGFVLYEKYGAREPLIRLSIFQNRTAIVNYLGTIIHGMVLWCLLYYEPLYYEAVKGYSPIIAGVAIFPETFTVAPVSVLTGFLVTLTGRYRWALWSGWVLTTFGLGILYLLDVDTSVVSWVFLNLACGIGMGLLFPSMAFAIQAASTNADLAFAVAMFSFFRAFGQTIGVAVGGTVFQNEMKKQLLGYALLASKAEEYSKDASSLVQVIKRFPEGPAKSQLIQSYADALKIVWVTMCAMSAVALILSLWTKGLDLNKPLETEQGFRDKPSDEEKR